REFLHTDVLLRMRLCQLCAQLGITPEHSSAMKMERTREDPSAFDLRAPRFAASQPRASERLPYFWRSVPVTTPSALSGFSHATTLLQQRLEHRVGWIAVELNVDLCPQFIRQVATASPARA